MNRIFVLLMLSLFSFTTMVEAQTKLLYPQQQVLKRQTMNMNEIQKEIDKQQQQGANDAVNAAQQALMAQFNQMLKNDPNLKSQFDAATPAQQATFMLQFGIIKPGGANGDQFSFLLQRLDGIVNDIEGGGVATSTAANRTRPCRQLRFPVIELALEPRDRNIGRLHAYSSIRRRSLRQSLSGIIALLAETA